MPNELVERQYAVARAFFDLPLAEKERVQIQPRGRGGYSPPQTISLARSYGRQAPPDLRQSLTYGRDVDSYAWPARPAELRATWCAYFAAMERLAQELLHIFAVALDLPETFFDDKVERGSTVVTVIDYPDQAAAPVAGQLRSSEHTDWGPLTIVRTEEAPGGLQVLNKAGAWVDVPVVPGGFVINLGDMLMRWTNDWWVSTIHRVANPPRDRALGSRRQSMVFFLNANADAEITCIPSCCSAEHPAKYPPMTAGEYLALKLQQTGQAATAQPDA